MATAWFYMVDGEEVGPISPAELKSLAQSGKVTRTDRVRRADMADWKPAGSIKGLIAPDEMKVPDVAPSIRSASKVKSSPSVPQKSQEAHLNARKSAGFMSVIWKWYKRYVIFILTLAWRIATSTWYAAKTIVGDARDRWETSRLKVLLAKEQVALGDKLYNSGFGQADIRKRIADKTQAIQNAETNKASTSSLAIEKQTLLAELANAELSAHSNEPTFQESIQAVQKTEESLINHEKHVAAAKSNRPPVDSTRAIIGAAFCGIILVVGAVNGDKETSPSVTGTAPQVETDTLVADYLTLTPGRTATYSYKQFRDDNVTFDGTYHEVARSPTAIDFDFTYTYIDTNVLKQSPEYGKRKNGRRKGEKEIRTKDGFVSLRQKTEGKEWDKEKRIIKIGAKPGDTWEAQDNPNENDGMKIERQMKFIGYRDATEKAANGTRSIRRAVVEETEAHDRFDVNQERKTMPADIDKDILRIKHWMVITTEYHLEKGVGVALEKKTIRAGDKKPEVMSEYQMQKP